MGATGAGGEGFTLAVLGPVRRLHDPVDCLGVQPVEYVGAFLELQTKVTKYKKITIIITEKSPLKSEGMDGLVSIDSWSPSLYNQINQSQFHIYVLTVGYLFPFSIVSRLNLNSVSIVSQ